MFPAGRRVSHPQVLALWEEYDRTHDPAARARLLATFAPLVEYLVYEQAREMPSRCAVGDFEACASEALIAAIEQYDPSRGATLEQEAFARVHGAVREELRRQDWAPRALHRWARDIARAIEAFSAAHGRRPGTRELAEALGLPVAELRHHREAVVRAEAVALAELLGGAGADHPAFGRLSSRDRQVAELLYVERRTLAQASAALGTSEAGVHDLHASLQRPLHAALEAQRTGTLTLT